MRVCEEKSWSREVPWLSGKGHGSVDVRLLVSVGFLSAMQCDDSILRREITFVRCVCLMVRFRSNLHRVCS